MLVCTGSQQLVTHCNTFTALVNSCFPAALHVALLLQLLWPSYSNCSGPFLGSGSFYQPATETCKPALPPHPTCFVL